MNDQTTQMITDIVQAMIDGGWNKHFNPRKKSVVAFKHPDYCYWKAMMRCEEGYQEYPLAVLLGNPEAMKAAYGDECAGAVNGISDIQFGCVHCDKKHNKNAHCYEPAWRYHGQQALKIAHEGGDYIKYLHDNLKDKTTQEE